MFKTRRRDLFGFAGGGLAATLGWALSGKGTTYASDSVDQAQLEHGNHLQISGLLANATVSFGQWPTDPPLDRHQNLAPLNRNGHQLIPNVTTIKAGGTVNFIIAGAHQIAVYDRGVTPGDIDPTLLISPAAGGPPVFIDDPDRRIYRGPDPSVMPHLSIPPPPAPPPASPQFETDRVEVVHFPKRGTYLVICTVVFHFVNDKMYGWVRVLP
jgi:plastocyanin